MDGKGIALRMVQISDLHIKEHRNLLASMIDSINRETLDLVVVTGDTVHFNDDKLYRMATNTLNKIRHRVIVLPGDYDNGGTFRRYFGDRRLQSINLNGYCLDFLDTSFMGHRFAVGWSDVLKNEDPEQYEWIKNQLDTVDKYHFVFSHHPFWVMANKEGDEYLTDNLRAIYSGHVHEPVRFYFKYDKPRAHFANGFASTPMKFHGNACYMLIIVKNNHEIVNIPRIVNAKRTAW